MMLKIKNILLNEDIGSKIFLLKKELSNRWANQKPPSVHSIFGVMLSTDLKVLRRNDFKSYEYLFLWIAPDGTMIAIPEHEHSLVADAIVLYIYDNSSMKKNHDHNDSNTSDA